MRARRSIPSCAIGAAAWLLAGAPRPAGAQERQDRSRAAADTALVLPAGFGPEGIALGADGRTFWVSSMRTGRLVLVAPDGAARPLQPLRSAALGAGWSALGLASVPARGALWVAASTLPQAEGHDAARPQAAALVELDLRTGAERRRIAAPAGVVLGDVVAHPDGRLFAADPRTGAIWAWQPGAPALAPLVATGTLRSAQGMAIAADGRSLVVADYARGLARVELATGAVVPLALAPGLAAAALRGLDGVVRLPEGAGDATSFAVVQNGAPPGRVLRVDVRRDTVVAITTLLAEHPALADPTLLALVPRLGAATGRPTLLLVAASLWPFLADDGSPRGTPTPTAILRLTLPAPGVAR